MLFFLPLLLLCAGVVTIFFTDIAKAFGNRRSKYMVEVKARIQMYTKKRRRTLKGRVQMLNCGERDNFISKSYRTMSSILALTGESGRIKQMKIISAVCCGGGVVLSLYLGSFMLVPILGVGFALLPMWLIKFKAYRYNIATMTELAVVLSMVTNSYVRSENIIKAVEENLEYMNEPVRTTFEWFAKSCNRVSSDICGNLELMKKKIDNRVFHLWCDSLIICQRDINQKSSLNAIVEQFATDKELLNMLSTEVAAPIQMFALVTVGTFSAFPLLAMVGQQLQAGDIMGLLFTGLPGQCIIVGYAVTILFGINRAIDLSTEI